MTGAHRAWKRDVKKQNKNVQLSVRNPIKHCRVYMRITDDAVKFYRGYFNLTNDESTITGPLEIWKRTEYAELAFKRHKVPLQTSAQQVKHEQRVCVNTSQAQWSNYAALQS